MSELQDTGKEWLEVLPKRECVAKNLEESHNITESPKLRNDQEPVKILISVHCS